MASGSGRLELELGDGGGEDALEGRLLHLVAPAAGGGDGPSRPACSRRAGSCPLGAWRARWSRLPARRPPPAPRGATRWAAARGRPRTVHSRSGAAGTVRLRLITGILTRIRTRSGCARGAAPGGPGPEVAQLHQECAAGDGGAGCSTSRTGPAAVPPWPAGHRARAPCAPRQGVGVHLERVDAVLELVLDRRGLPQQYSPNRYGPGEYEFPVLWQPPRRTRNPDFRRLPMVPSGEKGHGAYRVIVTQIRRTVKALQGRTVADAIVGEMFVLRITGESKEAERAAWRFQRQSQQRPHFAQREVSQATDRERFRHEQFKPSDVQSIKQMRHSSERREMGGRLKKGGGDATEGQRNACDEGGEHYQTETETSRRWRCGFFGNIAENQEQRSWKAAGSLPVFAKRHSARGPSAPVSRAYRRR